MKRIALPDPPTFYPSMTPLEKERAVSGWMSAVKEQLETAININAAPATSTFNPTGYTTNTAITGTTTGTDLSNVVATLIKTLIQKGILPSPGGTQ